MSDPENAHAVTVPPAGPAARTFRVFVSSPGDLGEERVICGRVVDRLKAEFARAARLQAILWEQEPLTADLDFQEQIPLPSQTDIVVLLLWSRLGYRLHSRFRAGGDAEAPTGTIFEFRDAINARRANPERVPDVLVYRKTAEPPKPSITDADKYLQALEEWRRVEAFFNSEFFRDAESGAFTGSFHTFKRAGEFEENFERHLRAMIVRRLGEDQVAAPRWTRGSPFRGLERFDFEHRDLFAGRARATAETLDALRRRAAAGCAFVMITSMSGGGKSSLARAGVLPDLIQPGVIEGIGLWRRATLRPGEAKGDIFRALAEALLPRGVQRADPGMGLSELAGEETGDGSAREQNAVVHLAERLRQNPGAGALLVEGALRQAAESARASEREKLLARRHERAAAGQAEEVAELDRQLDALKPPQARLALLIDQTEELFTDARLDAPARDAFLAALDALARGGRTWILATLRSDFFAQCETHPTLIGLKAGDGTYHLLPPTEAEISRMIRHPAAAAGLQFERDPRTQESLADVLLAAAARDPGALPLLEFTLDELYKKAAAANRQTLTRADYDALGGLEGALATRAEAVFNDIRARDARAAEALPTVFGALARLAAGDGAAVVSQGAPMERFAPAAAELVRAMIDARLLVSDQGQVRVAHEALLRHWGRARDWIAENRDFLRARIRVSEAGARWRAEGEAGDFLLPRGKPLAEGEDLLARRRVDLAPEEIAFIEASIDARRRQERAEARRRRRVLTAISSALILALIFAAVSFWQYGEARAAAGRATHARNEAEKLIEFMGVDLRDKLKPIGRLELLDSANQRVRAYYDSFGGQGSADSGIAGRESTALLNQGDILLARGDLPGALKTYRAAAEIRQRLARETPDDTGRQAELAAIQRRVGDALVAAGDLPEALKIYRENVAAGQRLVARDPSNIAWQRGLADSWTNVASVLQLQNDLPGALRSYREAEAIDGSMARAHPGDHEEQSALSASALNIGDVLAAQNDPAGSLDAFRRGSAIQQTLCGIDPKNAPWRRAFAVSLERIGDALDAQGDHAGALKQYQDGLAIHRKLAAQDPTNTDWQSDLYVTQTQVGDMLLVQGETDKALQQYADALAIQQKLVDLDDTNKKWQRNFGSAYERLGQALLKKNDAAGALKAFSDSLDIRRRLTAQDASNRDWQHNVFLSLTQIGDAQALARDWGAALKSYREALPLQQKLADDDPTNSDWQRDLAETQDKIGQTLEAQDNIAEALPMYREALAVYEKLSAPGAADPTLQGLVASVSYHLGRAADRQRPPDVSTTRAALERARTLLRGLPGTDAGAPSREHAAMLEDIEKILRQPGR